MEQDSLQILLQQVLENQEQIMMDQDVNWWLLFALISCFGFVSLDALGKIAKLIKNKE